MRKGHGTRFCEKRHGSQIRASDVGEGKYYDQPNLKIIQARTSENRILNTPLTNCDLNKDLAVLINRGLASLRILCLDFHRIPLSDQ